MYRLSVIIESVDFPDEVIKQISAAGAARHMLISTEYDGEFPEGGSYLTKIKVEWYKDHVEGDDATRQMHLEIPKLFAGWDDMPTEEYLAFSAVLAKTIGKGKTKSLHEVETWRVDYEVSKKNAKAKRRWECAADTVFGGWSDFPTKAVEVAKKQPKKEPKPYDDSTDPNSPFYDEPAQP